MRGLQYLLLSASTAAATAFLPIGPEGYPHVIESRYGGSWTGTEKGEAYEKSILVRDENSGELVKRQTSDNVTEYCRFWGHSSAMVNDKLYISGGISTFKENYRDGWVYLFSSAIMVDLGGGATYPMTGDDSAFSYAILSNTKGESTQMGAFWWDGGQSIYKYGGWFADRNTWKDTPQTRVREAQLWKLNLDKSSWELGTMPDGIHRAWGGAVASVPPKKRGYFLGGIVENRTETTFANAPGYEYLGDSFLEFDSDSATLSNKTYSTAGASSLGSIGLGNLVYIPDMGKEGILVFIGGAEGPSETWVPTGTTKGVILRDMNKVWVHDISNNRWYEQDTTLASGLTKGPAGRISACAVVAPASDKTSWNVFVFGGGDLDPAGSVYGDTWALSLPSFTWIQVDTKGDARFEHTCHLTKGNQMLVVGGRDKFQASAGDPAKNYTTNPDAWTCLKTGILSSFDLNAFTWEDKLPTNEVDYQVNEAISDVIGGNAKGGATKLKPDNDWSDAALGNLMEVNSGTTSPTSTSNPDDKSGGGTPIGPIVGGVVGGIVVIALIAFGLIFLRRHRKKKAAAAATAAAAAAATAAAAQQPPASYDPRQSGLYNTTPAPQYWQQPNNQAPPGYVWDPHSGEYYLPVPTPAPQSPPVGGYYKPHEEPKTGPRGQIAEMEQVPHAAPQELHG
ncbi:hypothetical protein EV426DRAFT_399786 [Tirmania nivea]|nr:hypothetical protein EV426DRAFT_399786 [Tirmania nivea]